MGIIHRLLALLLLIATTPAHAGAPYGSRLSMALADGWLFARVDVPNAASLSLVDANWSRVTLPHSFNSGDGERPDYYRGPAWYRRWFEVAAVDADRRLFVQFDGAATAADVFLNGRLIGRHEGGHAAFRFDLTPALVRGRNLLAVRVDNSSSRVISPLGGDFTLFGGLYRAVSLIETDMLHIDLLDHGGPGVYARAFDIRADRATIAINVRVANHLLDGTVPVTVRILGGGGLVVAQTSRRLRVPAGGIGTAQLRLTLPNPRLWDGVRDPYLYQVEAQLGEQGDLVSVPLGVRSFAFDPERGFILNSRPYPLRGANLMHSARPGRGTAVSDDEIAEDFAILKEMGATGVRLVHFQHPRRAYEEADRLGLVAWTEIGVNGEVADLPEFQVNAVRQLRELVAQNRNHPSVVMWGLGNEVYSTEPHVARILEDLNRVAHNADSGRPTVYAHCCQADDHPKAMVTDLIGFNRYFGWYPDQKGTIGEWAERFHSAHPSRPFAVSEYGAGASILHQEDPPRAVVPASGWHPEQFQAHYHEKNWLELKDKPYLWGTFVWVAFDLASAGRKEGDRPGINDKGLVSYDRRTRKDAFYWYQANWSDRPMLHLTSKRFAVRHDAAAEVKVYTNAGSATLFVNGVEIGSKSPEDHIVRWQIMLAEGPNRIEVRSIDSTLRDAVVWQYRKAPARLSARR